LRLEDLEMSIPNKKSTELDSFSQREHHTITQTHSLCMALQQLHDQQLSHQHISPKSVSIKPDHSIEVLHHFPPIPFDTCHEVSHQAVPHAYHLDFLSPEQRAQSNRTIDHSSDFFAIGMLMIHWLTDETPFRADDGSVMLQLPAKTDPVIVSIIEKLISLYPENRYLSLSGLLDDLQNTSASTVLFFPGKTDKAETLIFSDLLFGREDASNELQIQFNDVITGTKKCILISGEAGVGKTSIVSSTFSSLCKHRGAYCYGKVDFITYHPYSAIINAFSDLLAHHITNDTLPVWKPRLQTLLQSNAALLGNFIPELGRLLNTTFNEEDIDPIRLKNRLFYACYQILSLFSSSDSPTVFYIDDLQWMTPNELELLHYLFESDISHFMLVGAYRPSECKEGHPLLSTLRITEHTPIALDNLSLENTREWLYNLFKSDKAEALATMLYSKTRGNPFFTKKLLESLYANNIIVFNKTDRSWKWSKVQIQQANLGDNVVHLILETFRDLPAPTQRFLEQASCLGTFLKASTLSATFKNTTSQIATHVKVALEYNFISETDSPGTYKFTHDRLLRNIYFDIPESKRQSIHWEVAKAELSLHKSDSNTIPLIEACQHVTKGIQVIPSDDHLSIIESLRDAAVLAKANSDFKSSSEFYKSAKKLLPKQHWEKHHDLAFDIYLNEADLEFLVKNTKRNYELTNELKAYCKTDENRLSIFTQQLRYYDYMDHCEKAKEISEELLKIAKIKISGIKFEFTKIISFLKLIKNPQGSLNKSLPTMPEKTRTQLEIIIYLITFFYRTDNKMMKRLIFKKIELQSGYYKNDYTPVSLLIVGIFITHITKLRKLGMKICKVAFDINKESPTNQTTSQFFELYATFVSCWTEPLKKSIKYLEMAKSTGFENGELTYAYLAINNMIDAYILKGAPLQEVQNLISKAHANYGSSPSLKKAQLQIDSCFVETILTNSSRPLTKKQLFEEACASNNINIIAYLNIRKCTYYILKGSKAAPLAAKKALKLSRYHDGLLMSAENLFWSPLALSIHKEKQAKKFIRKSIKTLEFWTNHYKQKNLSAMLNILKGEEKVCKNQTDKAISYYKTAIQLSTFENNFLLTHIGYTRWAKALCTSKQQEKNNLIEKANSAYTNWVKKQYATSK